MSAAPLYKNLTGAEIAESVYQTCLMLKKYLPGTFTAAAVDEMFLVTGPGGSRLTVLESAPINDYLQKAVVVARDTLSLDRLAEFFLYHAVVNTDGIGADLFNKLNLWDALEPPMFENLTRVNHDVHDFMGIAYVDYMRNSPQADARLEQMKGDVTFEARTDEAAARICKAIEFYTTDASFEDKVAVMKSLQGDETTTLYSAVLRSTTYSKDAVTFIRAARDQTIAAQAAIAQRKPPAFKA